MASLPEEMIILILSRVPAKSILRFRCVSKRWLAIIDDSGFIKMHLNQSIQMDCINLVVIAELASRSYEVDRRMKIYLTDQDFKIQNPPLDLLYHSYIAGSCNGVVCYIEDCDVLLFNPNTREYKIVKIDNELKSYSNRFKIYANTSNGQGVYGLGCDSDEYKLVQFISHQLLTPSGHCPPSEYYSEQNSKINVYSLNDSSCLTISNIPYCFVDGGSWGIYLNGAIHWVAKRTNTLHEKLIISFDLREKVIRELPLPDVVDRTSWVTLGVLGGQLCIYLNLSFEIWVMKVYGSSSSWYKVASMDRNVFTSLFEKLGLQKFTSQSESFMHLYLSAAQVLCYSRSGDILLTYSGNLVLYNPKENTSRLIEIPGIDVKFEVERIITNLGSYVPLNSGSYFPVVE